MKPIRITRLALVLAPLWCACAAAPVVRPTKPSRDGRLRIVSFNVHLGEALLDERAGKDRSMLRAFEHEEALRDVDILGLQELCSDDGGWMLDYFDRVMRESGGASYHASALSDPVGKMMCARVEAIYSRFPIVDSGAITLPAVNEPRSAVWADVAVPSADGGTRTIRVYNAHLENRAVKMGSEEGRLLQTQVILKHLEAWRATHPDTPVVLLGDLNSLGHIWDFWRHEATIGALEAHHLAPSLHERERTLTMLPHQIDWIFTDHLQLLDSQVVHVWLSDHFPVVADYRFPATPTRGG